MQTPNPADLSVQFISWINDELRKEVDRRQRIARESAISTRVRRVLFETVTVLQPLVLGWL